MTHAALAAVALKSHAALLVGVLAAYYKFGDRTEVTARSLQGTEATLREVRRLIAATLADALREQNATPSTSSSVIITSISEQVYAERPSNFLNSERYRDAVREFVEGQSRTLADCRSLLSHRDAWMNAARRLSRVLLAFAAYEGLVAGSLAFVDGTDVYHFCDLVIELAGAPSALFFLAGLACMLSMLISHDRITEIRHRYAEATS